MPYEVKFVWFSQQKANEAEKELAEKLNEGWSIVGTGGVSNTIIGESEHDALAFDLAAGNFPVDGYVILQRATESDEPRVAFVTHTGLYDSNRPKDKPRS